MQLLDFVFCYFAMAYLLIATRAYCGMDKDDNAAYCTHFNAAAMLLVCMLAVVYLRTRCVAERSDFASTFPGMIVSTGSF